MSATETYTLADGTVVQLTLADAAGPDSRLHLNRSCTFIKFGDDPWITLGMHLHHAKQAIFEAIALGDTKQDLLQYLRDIS